MPDLGTNRVDPHNAFVVRSPGNTSYLAANEVQLDGVQDYIEWGTKNGFGIIDINIPHYITQPEDVDPLIPRADEKTLQHQIQELIVYIWDNYLQLFDVEDLFLIGVGDAYLGVKLLLNSRSLWPFLRKTAKAENLSD